MRSLWLAWMLALGPALPLPAQTPLSFRDALAITRQRNERWRAADATVLRAEAVRAEQLALYWPTVSVTGLYAHLNDRLFVNVPGLGPATVLQNDPSKVTLSARWTVFAGGRIVAANRAGEAGLLAAEQERRSRRQGITTELVDRYFKRRLAADVLEVRRQALATLDRHLDDAHRLRAAGQIARTEELRAEVAHAEADRDYKKARRDVDLATAALRATLGVDDDVVPTTPLAPLDSLEPREAFWVAADSGNPAIGRLAALEEQARQDTRAVRAEYLPAVSLFGQQELLQNHLNSTTDPNWIVGVGVRWDLFDGLGREHRFSAARRLEEAIGLERASARREVRTLVEARYDEYRSAIEQHTSLETSLALAQESLRAETRAFAAGVGTSLAVVDAELALSRTEVSRLSAMYDMDVALARLLEASGMSDRILDYLERRSGGTTR
jgi:outer membrane protein TolC